jgi:quercetin dioxygenase-like cupin family protein
MVRHVDSATQREKDMITTGQSITNTVTGETLVFRATSADTNGECVVVETFVQPDGAVAAAHVHPQQEETFEILAGELEFRLGKRTLVAKPGDRILVPAGTPHRFRNVGEETAHFVCEVRPALGFEQLIETMFSLAEDGKVNRKGMPNPFRLAVIARHHFDDVRLPFPPAWMQKLGLALGSPLGRLLGFKPTYEPAAPKAPTALGV